jgi:integrase
VTLPVPVVQELNEWRMAAGRPDDSAPIFPARNGGLWNDSAYRYWRRKVFNPAAETAGVEHPRPYDLRHSAASLALAEGRNPVEVAEMLGHSPQMLWGTYSHVIRELAGGDPQAPRRRKSLLIERADARTRTGDPFITSEVLYQLSYVGRGESV